MSKKIFVIFFSFIFLNVYGQKRKLVQGIIFSDSINLADVHIINKNTNLGTNSNDNGVFEIPVKLNDNLFISHINYKEIFIVVTTNHISNKKITINLEEKVEALKGITLGNGKSIFHVDKDILIYEVNVSAKSLNLPYAETKKEKDKSILKLQSGAVVSLDNLINSLNGKNKRAKKLKNLSEEDEQILKIRKHFTDDFFVTNLRVKKDFINQFLEFCKNRQIISDFKTKNEIEFMATIINHSKQFLYKVESDELYLSKN